MSHRELTDEELRALYRADPHAATSYVVATLFRQRELDRAEIEALKSRIEGTTCSTCLRMRGDNGGEG